ncbi:hypothetical protein [Anaerotignum sp.]|uniref:hypothetical protein n=1 Tax=Anaerotignum sp. TaxID=2039241 RepID=UPI00271501CD|nr:hypothetical protein [Anaerotignum sp.]
MRENRDCSTIENEYIDVIVNHKLVQLCNDCYHALGWKTISTNSGLISVKLRLERSKKIKNRVELCKLQRECEDVLMELERLLKLQSLKSKRMAWITSIIIILFFAGALITYFLNFLFLSAVFLIFGCTELGIVYFIFHKYIRKMNKRIILEINRHYDVIYYLCKKAEQLH